MKSRDKKFFYLSFVFCFVTGLGLYILESFYQIESPYGTLPHPYRATFLDMHLLSLPTMMISLGGLTFTHVIPELKRKMKPAKKYSGIALGIIFLISVISGQGIQIHFLPREGMELTHTVSSLLIVLVLIPHILYSRR